MRSFLWGAGVVVVSLTVVALLVVLTYVTAPPPTGGRGPVAQEDLQNALTAVRYYQTLDDGSLDGLTTGSEGVSSIQNLQTGLSYTTTASNVAHVISISPGVDGSFVVMAAPEGYPAGCFGILYMTARQPGPVFGEAKPGTYYFVQQAVTPCDASTVVPSAISTSGFPNG